MDAESSFNSALVTPASSPSLVMLFTTFFALAAGSFGGGLRGVICRQICAKKGWMTETELLGILARTSVLPGASPYNFAIMIGHRLRGWQGALVSLLGVTLSPLLIALIAMWAFTYVRQWSRMNSISIGLAAAAAGIIAAGAYEIGRSHFKGFRFLSLTAATFLLTGPLHEPLLPSMIGLCLIGVLWPGARHEQ
jgi:chromate transporter